jgi:hypothetical protein
MKIVLTENQIKGIISELSLSGIVGDFIKVVKDNHLFDRIRERYPTIKTFEDLENEIEEMTYMDFDELRSYVLSKEDNIEK